MTAPAALARAAAGPARPGPARAGLARRRWDSSGVGAWLALLLATAARIGFGIAAGLLLWSVVPAAFGWSPQIIMTGSMQPSLRPGDVTLTAPLGDTRLHPGMVVSFHEPGRPERILMHRIVAVDPDGTIQTRGDANPTPDSSPVPVDQITGLGRLRVPWIALAVVWAHDGAFGRIGVTAAAVAAGVLASTPRIPRGRHRRRTSRVPAYTASALGIAMLVALLPPPHMALSAFAGTTDSPSNKWTGMKVAPPTNFTATVNCTAASAPAYRDSTWAMQGSPVTSITMTVPSGTVVGDILLADVSFNAGQGTSVTPPAGWTLVRSDLPDSNSGNWLYSRVATAEDPGKNYTWSNGTSSQSSGTIVAYSGVNSTTPFDAPVAGTAFVPPPISTTIDAPSVTAATAPSTLVVFVAVKQGGTISTPTGMTPREQVFKSVSVAAFEQNISATGATGVRTATKGAGGASQAEAVTVLLRGKSAPMATLTWTPTVSARADGYLLSLNGGAATPITPASASSTTSGPLPANTAASWTLTTTAGAWTSTPATTSVTAAQTNC
ncbi:MAG: hypothetical protein BGO26_14220 [Actinobacteria bacterium 69-20]|nr:hypothetical protein [Actinomycetota bacterium]OJV29483.1 MAG: hypothetical protein BGO26_14220 [Actinobacteria bacterium 69-20]